MINVGFIGAGNMGFAIMKGVSESELCSDVKMYATSATIKLFAYDKNKSSIQKIMKREK